MRQTFFHADGFVTFVTEATGTHDVKYNEKAFTDISEHWATDHIEFVAAREVFSGTGSEKFAPIGSMIRAMFAMALSNLGSIDLSVSETSRFGDVIAG